MSRQSAALICPRTVAERGEDAPRQRGVRMLFRHAPSPSVATTASAITFSGRCDAWLALRSRANASLSVSFSFSISSPFARSITFLRREGLGERLGLVAHRLHLLVAGARSMDRRQQVLLAERLHEIAEDAGLGRPRDELLLPVRGQHHDRDRALVLDPPRRLDAVESRHLHVHDREVGLLGARELDRLLAVARLGAHLVPGTLEQVLEIETDDRLVLRHENPHADSVAFRSRMPLKSSVDATTESQSG